MNTPYLDVILKHLTKKDKIKKKIKVSKHDDRMMEDGTLNLDHPSLKQNYMTISEYNSHLTHSDGGI